MKTPKLTIKDKIFLILIGCVLIFSVVNRLIHRIDTTIETAEEQSSPVPKTVHVMIRDAGLTLETVSTIEAMHQGLSGRDTMDQSTGMMFLHQSPGMYEYTMREMKFGLDFIFVRGDRIVDIAKRVPQTFRGTIAGAVEYDTVIEVNAGWVEEHQVHIGDQVILVNTQQ